MLVRADCHPQGALGPLAGLRRLDEADAALAGPGLLDADIDRCPRVTLRRLGGGRRGRQSERQGKGAREEKCSRAAIGKYKR